VWWFGTWPEDEWSNAANGEMLLPLIYRLVVDARDAKLDVPWVPVGSTQYQTLPLQAMERVDHDSGDATQGVENLAGVYKIEGKYVAINRPEIEDDAVRLSASEIAELFRGVPWQKVQLGGKDQDHSLSIFGWRAFLVAVLLFMLVEAVLCLPRRRA
jgi:predicted aspartyl protease